ncbi:MAG TPA: TetR/AcrR family transcriptional regulator [Streptosporangiaceae bacterium]|jgi:AcrR family transcriptional regulator
MPSSGGEDLPQRVRSVIVALECSQREFARRIVMDPSKLSRSLNGTRRFTLAEITRIADTGRVELGWLLGAGGVPVGEPERDRQPDDGRPLQIIRASVALIAERGYHSVRVADIAAACGISTATIHYHFPGRDDLLEAALRYCLDRALERRSAGMQAAGDAHRQLLHLVDRQVPDDDDLRQEWAVWLDLWPEAARSPALSELHTDFYRDWRRVVTEIIATGVAQGVFRDVDPEAMSVRLTALIDGLALQVLAASGRAGHAAVTEMREALTGFVANELTVRSGPPGPIRETTKGRGAS